MKHYEKLQSAINFIEKNLTNKITVKDVSDNAFSSLWHFQRIFRYMTGYSIHSYIRKRRLSEAANELILTRQKIINLALKYQYETPETFLREFKKIYGLTPSQFRKIPEHKIFERINIFDEKYKSVYTRSDIEWKPVTKNAIVFIGKKFHTTMQKQRSTIDIPKAWETTFANDEFTKIPEKIFQNRFQGVYTNWDYDENFDFIVGSEVSPESKPPSGFVRHLIPPAKYMMFTIPGNTNEKLINGWKYIYGTWLPNSNYERGYSDDFDVFDERFYNTKNPVSDIYISIQ